jgi:hypothetical protein
LEKPVSATFVFFLVGNWMEPRILVRSIRKEMPRARIIQCSDKNTPRIDGVSELFNVEGDVNNLMTLRLKAFSTLGLDEVAVYLDMDMVLLRPLDAGFLLGKADAVVCERSFNREVMFNPTFRDRDWSMYKDKTLYEAHPYVACFTITKNVRFWLKAYELLLEMPDNFHYWFGDQEAIKTIVRSNLFQIKTVPESTYACLPDKVNPAAPKPRLLHFKGANRKEWMEDY